MRRFYLLIMKNLIIKSYFFCWCLILKRGLLNIIVVNLVCGIEEGKKVLIKVRLVLIFYYFVVYVKFCFLVKVLVDLKIKFVIFVIKNCGES